MLDTLILTMAVLPATLAVLSAAAIAVIYHRHNKRLSVLLVHSRTLVGELTDQTRASAEQLNQLAEDIRAMTPYIADLERRVSTADVDAVRGCVFEIRKAYDERDSVLLETSISSLMAILGADK